MSKNEEVQAVSADEMAELVMDKLDAKLEAKVKEIKEGLIDKPGETKETLDGVAKEVEFFKALFSEDKAKLKDLGTATGSAGGYTVPTEFYGRVIEKRKNIISLRNYVNVVPMGATTNQIPAEGNDMTIEWPGENTAASGADVTFNDAGVTAHRMTALGKLSRELVDDSGVDILDYLSRIYARAASLEEDRVIINGSGTGQPKGFRQHSLSANWSQTGASLDYDDVLELWFALAPEYRADAIWVAGTSAAKALAKVEDTGGSKIWIPSPTERALSTVLGRPLFETSHIPSNLGVSGAEASELWLFSPTFYTLGDRQDLGVEYSTEAGEAFAAHQGWLKVFKRIGGAIAISEAFAFMDAVV